MRLKSLVLAAMVALLVVAAVAPVASANKAGVKIKLKGPSNIAEGKALTLKATIKNYLKYGGGDRSAVLLQNKDGHLRRIASAEVQWTLGGSLGAVVFTIADPAPTAMGVAAYRVKWTNPGGTTYSNVWRVEID